jgi:hypothetical protein
MKNKAEELVNKFKPFVYCYMGSGMLSNTVDDDVVLMMAKKCAHIAIDELLISCDSKMYKGHPMEGYWLKVKSEIDSVCNTQVGGV